MNMQCVICGAEITKRSSLAYTTKDGKVGRACRTHTEVTQATQSRIDAEEAIKAREKEILEKKKERHQHRYDVPTGPSCWHCHKSGMHAHEHWMRMMVAVEKCSLAGKIPLGENLREAYGDALPVLVAIKVGESHPLVRQTREGYMFHNMSDGHMFVCVECAEKYGLKKEWMERLAPQEVSQEVLQSFMALQDILPVSVAAKQVAKQEFASEQGMAAVEKETSTIR